MEQTFQCSICNQEFQRTMLPREKILSQALWCESCASLLRQKLKQKLKAVKEQNFVANGRADIVASNVLSLSDPLTAVNNAPANNRGDSQLAQKIAWENNTFPHIIGSGYSSKKDFRGKIDAYTASYMRWKDENHVLAWLHSFEHPDALRPVFLDTETTGTRIFSEIIEICIVSEDGQTLFHTLVNPTTEIEPMASAVHGLTHKDVQGAPRYPEVHEKVVSLLQDRVVIAYNASFDVRLLKQTAECYDLTLPRWHIGCLMYAYAKYRAEYREQWNGQQRCKTHRLEEALKNEGISRPLSHRADWDAHCVHQLFQRLRASRQ